MKIIWHCARAPSPPSGGEGRGEEASPRVASGDVSCGDSAPLTPILSPQERGEGAQAQCSTKFDRAKMIIAIDGPAASGKGTLGKRLAAHYRLRHLDTGLLYRAVAKAVLDAGARPDDPVRAAAAARSLDPTMFDEAALKSPAVGEAASLVSAIEDVRAALRQFQKTFAATPPGAVLDGRDIGTVICPNADVKIFVTAEPEERARRRARELHAQGLAANEADILADIKRRDERDSLRSVAPLVQAPDAVLLDTTHLDIDAAVRAAIDIVKAARAARA